MDLKKKIIDFIHNAFDQPKVIEESVLDLYDQKALVHGPLGRYVGADAIRQHWKNWTSAFSDFSTKCEMVPLQGGVLWTWMMKIKHTGLFKDIPPTGKWVYFSGVSIYQFGSDNICSHQYQTDIADVYKQLGYYHAKEVYPRQGQIRLDYETLLGILKKMGEQNDILTKQEVVTIACYLQGRTAKEIAARFKINFRTVQTHLNNGMHKVGCQGKAHLYEFVSVRGLAHIFRDFYDLVYLPST
ncbi:MAG: ester cyclase [Chlamydiales bacterium]|nr:ester cyclase [Chlamydiales bacterium]